MILVSNLRQHPREILKEQDTVGFGTATQPNANLGFLLKPGNYVIYVTSSYMVKKYSVTVQPNTGGQTIAAEEESRTILMPELAEKTRNSVTLAVGCAENDVADGNIQYGWWTTNDGIKIILSGRILLYSQIFHPVTITSLLRQMQRTRHLVKVSAPRVSLEIRLPASRDWNRSTYSAIRLLC